MTQTTDGLNFRVADVDFGADNTFACTASNTGSSVATSGGDRSTGFQHTFDGDVPILGAGKLDPIDVTVRYVYTVTGGETFEDARAIYESDGGTCYIRWSPSGSTAGEACYYSSTTGDEIGPGVMVAFKYPEGEAASGDIIMGEFTVRCACICTSVMPG